MLCPRLKFCYFKFDGMTIEVTKALNHMRNIIIGIIIGIVFGIMAGTSVITPGLQNAQNRPVEATLPRTMPNATTSKSLNTMTSNPSGHLKIINLFAPKSSLSQDITAHIRQGFAATFSPPNALVPEQDSVNAVKSGTIDALFGAPSDWDPTSPTLQLFSGIPFGPDAQEFLAWFYKGGGQALFQAQFSRQQAHGILCGVLPPSGSGWWRKPIRNVEDFKGLNLSIKGLGGEVLKSLGAHIQTLKAGDIHTAFKNGTLDGAQFSLPSVDEELGLDRTARHYYFPSWQQSTSPLALIINAKVWKSLSQSTQQSITQTCGNAVQYAFTTADALQFEALKKLGLSGVQVRRWPAPILKDLKATWKGVAREWVQKDPDFNAAWSSLHRFRRDYSIWRELSIP